MKAIIYVYPQEAEAMYKWMKDDFSNNIINHPDTFELYTHITKYCHNAKPEFVYKDSIFDDYKINKLPKNVNYLLFCF